MFTSVCSVRGRPPTGRVADQAWRTAAVKAVLAVGSHGKMALVVSEGAGVSPAGYGPEREQHCALALFTLERRCVFTLVKCVF